MTDNQHTGRLLPATARAALWRGTRCTVRVLRAIHDEQVHMWELFWQAGRVPVVRPGPLAWIPSLDGPRLTGSRLSIPGEASAGGTP